MVNIIYKKYNGEIPFKIGDTVEFYDWKYNEKILRKGGTSEGYIHTIYKGQVPSV